MRAFKKKDQNPSNYFSKPNITNITLHITG